MARKSAIAKLPPQIQAEVDRLIRGGRATIDDIVAHLRQMDVDVSRSSVGRYKQTMEQRLARYREAQEVAGKWVASLGEQPDSQTGQLLAELLKTVAFRTLADMQDQEHGAEPEELMLLARSLKDMAAAQKTDMEFRKQLRAAFQAEMAERARAAEEELKEVARSAGLTADAEKRIREIVLGVVQ